MLLLPAFAPVGCIPGVAHTRGEILPPNTPQAGVLVTYWDYPSANYLPGVESFGRRVEILDVTPLDGRVRHVAFPPRLYPIVWTPVLGTQHISPAPGVLLCQTDALPLACAGQTTGDMHQSCCEPPAPFYRFPFNVPLDDPLNQWLSRDFREAFLRQRDVLAWKLRHLDVLSDAGRAKLLQATTAPVAEPVITGEQN